MSTKKTTKSDAVRILEKLTGGALTLGRLLQSIRTGEDVTLAVFAKRLKVSRQNLCDIEKGRKLVSPERAARFAHTLGYSEAQFVALALQSLVDQADLNLKVEVKAA